MERRKKQLGRLGDRTGEAGTSPNNIRPASSIGRWHFGLDTLRVNFWVDFRGSRLLDALAANKLEAQTTDKEDQPADLGGSEWNVSRVGTRAFAFRARRGDVQILAHRRHWRNARPNFRLEIGSVSCWRPGYLATVKEIKKLLEYFGAVVREEKVAEAHLAADRLGVNVSDIPIDQPARWITRARSYNPYYFDWTLTGITLGSGDCMLRIYDKVKELGRPGSDHKRKFFADLWDVDLSETDVTRVEFQIRRPVLKEFNTEINTVLELVDNLASIWRYCCRWAQLTAKDVDRNHNQGKAPRHWFWSEVRLAVRRPGFYLKRIKPVIAKDLAQLNKLAAGVGMSIAALLDRKAEDLEGIICFAQGAVETELRQFWRYKQREFIRRMNVKRNAGLYFTGCPA